jgi:hypothetical protein
MRGPFVAMMLGLRRDRQRALSSPRARSKTTASMHPLQFRKRRVPRCGLGARRWSSNDCSGKVHKSDCQVWQASGGRSDAHGQETCEESELMARDLGTHGIDPGGLLIKKTLN